MAREAFIHFSKLNRFYSQSGRICLPQCRQLCFEFLNSLLKLFDDQSNFPLRKTLVDVLRTVDVPRLNFKKDDTFDPAGIISTTEPLFQCSIALYNFCIAPQFDAAAVNVVHQEDECLRIFRQIPQADELLVATKISEAECLIVDDFQETGRTTSVLNIRLPLRRWLSPNRTYPTEK